MNFHSECKNFTCQTMEMCRRIFKTKCSCSFANKIQLIQNYQSLKSVHLNQFMRVLGIFGLDLSVLSAREWLMAFFFLQYKFLPCDQHINYCGNTFSNATSCYFAMLFRAQRDSIRGQTLHSKGIAYDITKYQTFFTK